MEQQTQARALVDQGNTLLNEGEIMPAAAAFAEAVQIEPNEVGGHLGLAEANLALGVPSTVYLASRQVQLLAPNTADADLARAITLIMDRRYDAALPELDSAAARDPGRAYIHALRGFCLRRLGHTYDAVQADGKARRLSSGVDFTALLPKADALPPTQLATQSGPPSPYSGPPPETRPWSERSEVQRQAVRMRFALRNVPVLTYALIAINVLIYIACAIQAGDLLSPATVTRDVPIYDYGVQIGALMQNDPIQWYRVVTAMFLHLNYIHIGVNMLSLFFVGVPTERIFGRWRFLLIYFATGIAGGLVQYFFTPPNVPSLGASGAIFGIFGAFGAFIVLRRQFLRGGNAIIGQWLFWLAINLYFDFSQSQLNIGTADHIGGVVAGFILGAILIPPLTRIVRSR